LPAYNPSNNTAGCECGWRKKAEILRAEIIRRLAVYINDNSVNDVSVALLSQYHHYITASADGDLLVHFSKIMATC